jgi:CXXX repeat modification system protein
MKFLIVPLDASSGSFCHYERPLPLPDPAPIPEDVLRRAVGFAGKNGLTVNFLYGRNRPPASHQSIIESGSHAKIVPLGLAGAYPDGVVVIESREIGAARRALSPDRNIIVRLAGRLLPRLAETLPPLFGAFRRMNLCITGLEDVTGTELDAYGRQLQDCAGAVADRYHRGEIFELSFLSDRITLDAMKNCEAGSDHLTVGPDGGLYLCPGFLYDDPGRPVGSLSEGARIPNPELLGLDHAPLCRSCDAFHCKRCIYLNKKLTCEVNTPSRQQCLASHLEREASGRLLALLRDLPPFADMRAIPPLDYADPLESRLRPAEAPRRTVSGTPARQTGGPGDQNERVIQELLTRINRQQEEILQLQQRERTRIPMKNNGHKGGLDQNRMAPGPAPKKVVGRVTAAERDEIRALFEKKNGLTELFRSLSSLSEQELQASALYERVVRDMGEVTGRFQAWWDAMGRKYSWENIPGFKWEIDFDTCDVFLIRQ